MHTETEREVGNAVSRLQQWLDQTIRQIAGCEGLEAVVKIRELAQSFHADPRELLPELTRSLTELTTDERRVVARALSILLDLMNVAEDRQRVRVLRERERSAHPEPRAESIRAAIAQLNAEGLAADDLQRLLERLNVELVFTAHPTEAKRRSIRRKMRRFRELLQRLDSPDLLPREIADLDAQLNAELTKLWQTDFIRPWPPTYAGGATRAEHHAGPLGGGAGHRQGPERRRCGVLSRPGFQRTASAAIRLVDRRRPRRPSGGYGRNHRADFELVAKNRHRPAARRSATCSVR